MLKAGACQKTQYKLTEPLNGAIFIPGNKNPLVPGQMVEDRRHALYKLFALNNKKLAQAARAELAEKNLTCWCPMPHESDAEDECHAVVLLKLANNKRSKMIEYELSIFLLITSTIILAQISFRDFFLKKLHISTESYARSLFYLTAL